MLSLSIQCAVPSLAADLSGREIMEQVQERHRQYPWVFEEQSIVLTDRNGKRDSRKAIRYSRAGSDGDMDFLLVFSFPSEVRGVAVLAHRDPSGSISKQVYLPALGQRLVASTGAGSEGNFLGTDFSVEDLAGDAPQRYAYVRRGDTELDSVRYYTVDVYAGDGAGSAGVPLRRHFVRQDIFFVTRTDHYDGQGRVQKRQTWHDLVNIDDTMWRSNMILMIDVKEQHETLVKIDRRVLSRDYVPDQVFTAAWLFENYPEIRDPEPDTNGDATIADSGGDAVKAP